MDVEYQIGFIGAGNMTRAIASSIINKGIYKPSDIIVSARSKESLDEWEKKGVHVTLHNCKVVSTSWITFIAVKPQQFINMVSSLHGDSVKGKIHLFISLMAGVKIDDIKQALLPAVGGLEVIRVMPNIPLLVGHGCSVLCPESDACDQFKRKAIELMTAGGTCDIVTESQINAVTAVSGSGPAYIFLVIEAMVDGGVKCGLPRDLAMKLAYQTVIGAGQMVKETGSHPGLLKDQVCSPGGTTIHGVHALETSGVRVAFMNAVEAAYKRASSLQ